MEKTLINKIRKSQATKVVSAFLALSLVHTLFYPTEVMALTSGPSQPEFQSFEPVEASNMVDLFSGDFTYNIPLFELPGPNGGYPFNLAYNSGITMDQEASWVGLGWNVNPGVINRGVRGIPDDFTGHNPDGAPETDYIHIKKRMLDNHTYGLSPGFSFEVFGGNINAGVGMSVYYNNYRGMGYSVNPSFSLGLGKNKNVGVGASLSLDSQSGVGMNADLSVKSKFKRGKHTGEDKFGVGMGFHSEQGFSYSTNYSTGPVNEGKGKSPKLNRKERRERRKQRRKNKSGEALKGAGIGVGFGFSSIGNGTPSTNFGTKTLGVNLTAKFGAEGFGIFSNTSFSGFWRGTFIKDEYKNKYYEPIGYNYLQHSGTTETAEKNQLMDYNRYKEGALNTNTSNLPFSQMTYDMYSVTGQGIGGTFRPHRNSFAHLHKNRVKSNTNSFALGGDFGGGFLVKVGLNGSYTYGQSQSGEWKHKNGLAGAFTSDTDTDPNYEDYYFKFQGETTTYQPDELNGIGGEEPVSPEVYKQSSGTAMRARGDNLNFVNGGNLSITNFYKKNRKKERASNIEHYINRNLLDYTKNLAKNSKHIPGEYQVEYYDMTTSSPNTLNGFKETKKSNIIEEKLSSTGQSIYKRNHIGGFSILKNDGKRYVYGIPVYNRKKVEATFSVDGSQLDKCKFNTTSTPTSGSNNVLHYEVSNSKEMLDYKETSPYATSYLMTSILGADYVDTDNIPGPSEGDMGYWVKFNYIKTDNDYQWRAPFVNARFNQGFENNFSLVDDMASYQYGQKEVYYLASVETSSHIAVFELQNRTDGFGAAGEFNSSNNGSTIDTYSKNYGLDKIKLYTKSEYQKNQAVPIKTVYFKYADAANTLCKNILNSSDGNKGKLTLESVSFSYGTNERGKITPYTFDYNQSNFNPGYSEYKVDRWGNYQTSHSALDDECSAKYHTYTYQFDETKNQTSQEKIAFDQQRALEASAWNLSRIGLPSGGTLKVNYESDDYAYVQHRKATQMFKIIGINAEGSTNIDGGGEDKRKLVFKLEHPIKESLGAAAAKEIVKKQYFEALEREGAYQLFFKTRIRLKDNLYQPVSGWATFDINKVGVQTGASVTSINGANHYTQGYVIINQAQIPNTSGFNPIEIAGMMHLRTNQPEMLTVENTPATITPSSSTGKMMRIKGLSSMFYPIMKMFSNFYSYCRKRSFCTDVSLNESFMRLGVPDGKKYGGGVRVKSIEIHDNWGTMTTDATESAVYGHYYDYTTKDDAGNTISSGVAANEPMIGGEESALRFARFYGEKSMPAAWGGNSLFFEYPINEAYYPGASVGYSKITVMSKNTKDQLDAVAASSQVLSSTGVAVNEFYTAKDYPVIANETNVSKKMIHIYVPIPLIGLIDINKMGYGQGYSVVLNDMHGKQKSSAAYAIGKDGIWEDKLITKQEYIYKDEEKYVDGIKAKKLKNQVTTIRQDFDWTSGTVPKSQRIIGEDYEFFMESNVNRSTNTMGGLTFDVDGFFLGILPIALTTFWPSFSRSVSQNNYAVVNKVIYKTGIIDQVVSTDEKAKITQKNEYYDEFTGEPIVMSTINKYNTKVSPVKTYEYKTPAYWNYSGMAAAYSNYDFVFKANVNAYNSGTKTFTIDQSSLKDRHGNAYQWNNFQALMHRGDELLISNSTGKKIGTLVTLGTNAALTKFYSDETLSAGTEYIFRVIKSGRKNLLSPKAGSLVSFNDPTTRSKIPANNGNNLGTTTQLLANYLNTQLVGGLLQNGTLNLALNDPNYPGLSLSFTKIVIENGPSSNVKSLKLTSRLNSVVQAFTIHNIGIDHFYESSNQMYYKDQNNRAISAFELKESLIAPGGEYQVLDNVLMASAVQWSDTWPVVGGTTNPNNPYGTGEKGIYRPFKDYAYDANRLQTSGLNLKEDGVYYDSDLSTANKKFYAFSWYPSVAHPNHYYWKANRTITKYNNKGFEVENKDALGIPSSAKYGYAGMLPVMVGQNISYDFLYSLNADDPSEPTLWYSTYLDQAEETSHTGKKSFVKKASGAAESGLPVTIPFVPGKKYVFSAWGSNGFGKVGGVDQMVDYTAVNNVGWNGKVGVELRYYNSGGTEVFNTGYSASNREVILPSGNKIEQWQRIEGEFRMPANATKVEVHLLEPTQLAGKFYWDDIRIYPVGSLVKTFIYDPTSLYLKATLDENNYSTQYIYDESGNVYSTRVETPVGVKSINETRAYTQH